MSQIWLNNTWIQKAHTFFLPLSKHNSIPQHYNFIEVHRCQTRIKSIMISLIPLTNPHSLHTKCLWRNCLRLFLLPPYSWKGVQKSMAVSLATAKVAETGTTHSPRLLRSSSGPWRCFGLSKLCMHACISHGKQDENAVSDAMIAH